MSQEIEAQIWEALKKVHYPGMSRDIVSFGFVKRVEIDGGAVEVELEMSTHNPDAAHRVRTEVEEAIVTLDGVDRVEVKLHVASPASRAAQSGTTRDPGLLPEVHSVIAVASGKGGVGKSTIAANLAVRMAQLGFAVGLLDADIYGPSLPTMFGITDQPVSDGQKVLPFEKYGIKLMSLGFLMEMDTPVIWRGPMVNKALRQLLGDVDWGKLDYLIFDLPPGTGDTPISLSQMVSLAGAVIVSTPQDVALIDARKGLAMFKKVNVPILGIIENMSGFACPHCGEVTDIFKKGGGERTAEVLGTPFLGKILLDPAIVQGGDSGEPIVVTDPDGPHAEAFKQVSEAITAEAARRSKPLLRIV